jgi:hypothetical protein
MPGNGFPIGMTPTITGTRLIEIRQDRTRKALSARFEAGPGTVRSRTSQPVRVEEVGSHCKRTAQGSGVLGVMTMRARRNHVRHLSSRPILKAVCAPLWEMPPLRTACPLRQAGPSREGSAASANHAK